MSDSVHLLRVMSIMASCVAGKNLSGFQIYWATKLRDGTYKCDKEVFLPIDAVFSLPVVKFMTLIALSDIPNKV